MSPRQDHAAPAAVARQPGAEPHLVPLPGNPASQALRPARLAAAMAAAGVADPVALTRAAGVAERHRTGLVDVLVTGGTLTAEAAAAGLALALGLDRGDPAAADPALVPLLPARVAARCLAIPTGRIGRVLVVATARPEMAAAIGAALPRGMRLSLSVLTPEEGTTAVARLYGDALARQAECRPHLADSCRDLAPRGMDWRKLAVAGSAAALVCGLLLRPEVTAAVLSLIAVAVIVANTTLKGALLLAAVDALPKRVGLAAEPPGGPVTLARRTARRLPRITIMAPLLKEARIATSLVARLQALDYPADLLEVLLVVESDDLVTRRALAGARLPPWMRTVVVPDGAPRTKPRALNYALAFARGDIVGIYDAEDAPEPDQLRKVAAGFAAAPPDVACLQGGLNFYNARRNPLSRCFAIEYAGWFRVLLPGVARLGLVVPLGGTTLFVRRRVLEEVGAWDAHNVTEDADLGVRLYRRGWRTQIVATTTYEEATAAPISWIKQRTRWMKGYAVTYAVHMRAPRRLLADLGPRAFWALQIQFAGTIAGFLMAPLMWSLYGNVLIGRHPLNAILGPVGYWAVGAVFAAALAVNLAISVVGTRGAFCGLRAWIPALSLYYPMATIATIRGVWGLLSDPFSWAKTDHGSYGGTQPSPPGS